MDEITSDSVSDQFQMEDDVLEDLVLEVLSSYSSHATTFKPDAIEGRYKTQEYECSNILQMIPIQDILAKHPKLNKNNDKS